MATTLRLSSQMELLCTVIRIGLAGECKDTDIFTRELIKLFIVLTQLVKLISSLLTLETS